METEKHIERRINHKDIDKKLRDRVDTLFKLARKLYPERMINLVANTSDIPARMEERVYKLLTTNDPTVQGTWKLTQEGQIGPMIRYIKHELECGAYRK